MLFVTASVTQIYKTGLCVKQTDLEIRLDFRAMDRMLCQVNNRMIGDAFPNHALFSNQK